MLSLPLSLSHALTCGKYATLQTFCPAVSKRPTQTVSNPHRVPRVFRCDDDDDNDNSNYDDIPIRKYDEAITPTEIIIM